MSDFQNSSAGRAKAVACLAFFLLIDASAIAAPVAAKESVLISPTQKELLIRSYRRCVSSGLDHKRTAEEATLLAGSYPFDLDALSLVSATDIERAPQERVNGTVYLSCQWFGLQGQQLQQPRR